MTKKIITIFIISLCFLSCQKRMLNLAEADKPQDQPKYTIKADLNTPGGVAVDN